MGSSGISETKNVMIVAVISCPAKDTARKTWMKIYDEDTDDETDRVTDGGTR